MPKATNPPDPIALSPPPPGPSSLAPPDRYDEDTEGSDIVHLSKDTSRQPSPFAQLPHPDRYRNNQGSSKEQDRRSSDFGSWDETEAEEGEEDMPSDMRSGHHQPLLPSDKVRQSYEGPRPTASRRSSRFHESNGEAAKAATKKRYTYAGAFLLVSLVSFAVQTETAVYIQHNLHWNKAYCML